MIYHNERVLIPPFSHPDVSGVTFGGVEIAKYLASQPSATPDNAVPNVADNVDPGVVWANSRAGVAPWTFTNYWNARKACCNLDDPARGIIGNHLCTVFEHQSAARWSHKFGTQPHGSNNNVNPPSDFNYTDEVGILNRYLNTKNATYYSALPGTGPTTWSHNHDRSGIYDLNGIAWEWRQGLHLMPANFSDNSVPPHVITDALGAGYVLVLATLNVSQLRAPYGQSTAVGAGFLRDNYKSFVINEFAGGFLLDVDGHFYYINSNTATDLVINATPHAGPYEILRLVATDITAGLVSDNLILTLRDSDVNLKAFGIPATTDIIGSSSYGNDIYLFNKSIWASTLSGGYFSSGSGAGIFSLYLAKAGNDSSYAWGFRSAKSI